jgi:hypothetical protein
VIYPVLGTGGRRNSVVLVGRFKRWDLAACGSVPFVVDVLIFFIIGEPIRK